MISIPKVCVLSAALACTAFTSTALAERGVYFGGGFSMADIETERFGDFSMNTLDIAGGFMLNDFMGFEARLGTGVTKDTRKVNPGTSLLTYEVKTEISNYYGFYLRPQYQHEHFQGYLLLGYGGGDVNMSARDLPEDDQGLGGSDSGTSWGAGVGFSPDTKLFFNLEYMSYIESDNYDFTGINLRVEFKL